MIHRSIKLISIDSPYKSWKISSVKNWFSIHVVCDTVAISATVDRLISGNKTGSKHFYVFSKLTKTLSWNDISRSIFKASGSKIHVCTCLVHVNDDIKIKYDSKINKYRKYIWNALNHNFKWNSTLLKYPGYCDEKLKIFQMFTKCWNVNQDMKFDMVFILKRNARVLCKFFSTQLSPSLVRFVENE